MQDIFSVRDDGIDVGRINGAKDFNSHVFFKAHFNITVLDGFEDEDLHWLLVTHVRKWLTRKYNHDFQRIPDDSRIWSQFKRTGEIVDRNPKRTVFCDSIYYKPESDWESEIDFAWACRISEYEYSNTNPTRIWKTDFGVEFLEPTLAVVSYVVSFTDLTSWYLGEPLPEPAPNVPGLMLNLLNDPRILCYVGSDRLQIAPRRLESGDFPEFYKLIARQNRKLPIVYLSPFNIESRAAVNALQHFVYEPNPHCPTCPLLSPKGVFHSVCCNALVFYSMSLDFSSELMAAPELPRSFHCKDGVVKVYNPNVPLTEEAGRQNRFLTIEQILRDRSHWFKILRTAFAQGIHYKDNFFLFDNCKRLVEERSVREKVFALAKSFKEDNLAKEKERQSALKEAEASVEKTKGLLAIIDAATAEKERIGEKASEFEQKYTAEVHARLAAEENLVQVRTELNAARTGEKEAIEMAKMFSIDKETIAKEKDNVSAELIKARKNVVALQSQLTNRRAMASIKGFSRKYSVGPFPKTLIDAIHWAEELLPNLVFLDHVFASAKDQGSRDPAFLWEMLCALNTDLFKIVFVEGEADYVTAFNQSHTAMKLATERRQTRKDSGIRTSRTDVYKDKRYTFWAHLKDSSGKPSELIRVYFDFVQDEKKILVYSAGPHEETAGTRRNGH